MIRSILVLCLLANTLAAQDPNTTLPADCKCECNCAERMAKLEADVAALKGQVALLKHKEHFAAKTVCKIHSWVGCKSCPLVKKWAIPLLVGKGMVVQELPAVANPEPGKIYPYFEFEMCTDTTCTTVFVQVPTVQTPLTPQWLNGELESKQIVKSGSK